MDSAKVHDIFIQLNEQERKTAETNEAKRRQETEFVAKKLADIIHSASTNDFKKTQTGLRLEGTLFMTQISFFPDSVYLVELLRTKYNVESVSNAYIHMIHNSDKIPEICWALTCLLYPLATCIYDCTHVGYVIDFDVETKTGASK